MNGDDEREVELAEREAAAVIGTGWELEPLDGERFRLPGARVQTYAAVASGPGDRGVLVVAVGKANAYRQLVRRLRGELDVTDGWAVPVPQLAPAVVEDEFLGPYGDEPDVEQALAEAIEALPEGWRLYEADRERYRLPKRKLECFAVSAVGPAGEAALVLAVGEANAYRQLAKRLRGELDVTDAWAPPL